MDASNIPLPAGATGEVVPPLAKITQAEWDMLRSDVHDQSWKVHDLDRRTHRYWFVVYDLR